LHNDNVTITTLLRVTESGCGCGIYRNKIVVYVTNNLALSDDFALLVSTRVHAGDSI